MPAQNKLFKNVEVSDLMKQYHSAKNVTEIRSKKSERKITKEIAREHHSDTM